MRETMSEVLSLSKISDVHGKPVQDALHELDEGNNKAQSSL